LGKKAADYALSLRKEKGAFLLRVVKKEEGKREGKDCADRSANAKKERL